MIGHEVSAALTYEAIDGSVLHCPMVVAEVGGVQTLLIVDTGASDHVLTAQLCRGTGLPQREADPGTDSSGTAVPSWEVGPVDVALSGSAVHLERVYAIEAPAPFPGWGVGGILSPQRLAPDSTTVLDLQAARIVISDTAVQADASPLPVLRQRSGTLAVIASVGPLQRAVALLDTGAATTEIAWNLPVDVEAPASRGVSGIEIECGTLHDQQVIAGTYALRLAQLGTRAFIPCPEDAAPGEEPAALLGMDVLRRSVLILPPVGAHGLLTLAHGEGDGRHQEDLEQRASASRVRPR